ncbi:MAG: methylmalonyl-CoA epimerase [candidate division Zixibacteria bacterium]|nr:methylmalonyl-CoA epimerase [Candidatus Tariuqbacter arcticus]
MTIKIDHIGVALSDSKETAKFLELLELKSHRPEEIPDQMVKVRSFTVGESEIELLTPTSPDSPIAKFLESKGLGIHHIAIRVDDIEAEIARLKSKGCRIVDEKPRQGAGGKLIAFIHPKSTGGILIELVQAE